MIVRRVVVPRVPVCQMGVCGGAGWRHMTLGWHQVVSSDARWRPVELQPGPLSPDR